MASLFGRRCLLTFGAGSACAAASVALRGREHSEHSAAVLMADDRTPARGRGVALLTALQDAAAGGSVRLSTAIDRLGRLGIANVLPGLGTVALAEGGSKSVFKIQAGRPLGGVLNRHNGMPRREGEPSYTRDDVSKRDGQDGNRMWVTFQDGVYDVTEFHAIHPGGHYILTAAGGPIDSFWEYWAYHHHSPKVKTQLDALRIGFLVDWVDTTDKVNTPYIWDPHDERGPGQRVMMQEPWCTQTGAVDMNKGYFTANASFYVRNHTPVPRYDGAQKDWDVTFTSPVADISPGDDCESTTDLAKLAATHRPVKINSILQCAGNRAIDNIKKNDGSGFVGSPFENIEIGMLGNALWGGLRMRDVLQAQFPGLADLPNPELYHVECEGADGYAASVPLALVMDPKSDCLLAMSMNGVDIPADHGYPLRAFFPAVAGARSVKWVTRISVLPNESKFPWNSLYYKEDVDGKKASIVGLPLQSLVLSPEDGTTIPSLKTVRTEGVAFSGGTGNRVTGVEVSLDRGKSWHPATINRDEVPKDDSSRHYGWVRWSAEPPAPPRTTDPIVIWCRATDDKGTEQPEVGPLNGGYVYNGYHEVTVTRG